jgi:hypothetical protein
MRLFASGRRGEGGMGCRSSNGRGYPTSWDPPRSRGIRILIEPYRAGSEIARDQHSNQPLLSNLKQHFASGTKCQIFAAK